MVKMLIYIEDTAHERLRRISFERHVSMAAIVREAVDKWLRQQKKKGGARR